MKYRVNRFFTGYHAIANYELVGSMSVRFVHPAADPSDVGNARRLERTADRWFDTEAEAEASVLAHQKGRLMRCAYDARMIFKQLAAMNEQAVRDLDPRMRALIEAAVALEAPREAAP